MQRNCQENMDGRRPSQAQADVFDIDLETDFLLAHSDQLTPH
jgi:hypothetical protein